MADPVSLFADPIVSKVVEILSNLLQEKFISFFDVKKHIESLKENLNTLQDVIKEAEVRKLEDTNLKSWLLKLKDAAYDADDILDTFATEVFLLKRKHMKGHNKLWLRVAAQKSDTSKKVRNISDKIDNMVKERNVFGIDVVRRYPEVDVLPTSSYVETADVIGRETDREKLVNLLLSDEYSEEGRVCVIPIVGMGGVGKTTLAQYVFNDPRVKKRFKPAMWACVRADYSLLRILKDMIQSHSKMEYGESLSREILEARVLEILSGNAFLLVLDDVWLQDYNRWDELQKLLKKGDKGSRVLVTSRTHEVCRVMGTREPFHLEYLHDDKCWLLFRKIAFGDFSDVPRDSQSELEDIGRQIVSKCQGLPLAVKQMAGLLRRNTDDINKWHDVLSSSIWELDNKDPNSDNMLNIIPALKLSYNYLPSHLKQCFAYCSLFPKSHVFVKEELVKIWIAQGYVLPTSRRTADEIGIEYFRGLLARFFFEVAETENNERYKMHDLIHELAQSVSSPHCCQVKDFRSNNSPQDLACTSETRHFSLLDQDVEQPALMMVDVSIKTRTLLLPTTHTKNFGAALSKIFTSLKYLRTLDLSSNILQELPGSIEDLKLLRYLDLSRTEIKLLPNSICNLYNLQVLKLLGCNWLSRLPDDFYNLVNLCHLEIDEIFWFKCQVLPARIGNLTSLRNWHTFHVSRKKGYRIEELEKLVHLSGTLHISKLENAVNAAKAKLSEKKHIRKLVLEWSNNEAAEERVLEDLQPHRNLKELQIFCHRGNQMPTWMTGNLLQNLETLSLTKCSRWKILTLGDLPRLRALYIKKLQELEEISEGEFSSLKLLNISNCHRLLKLPEFFYYLEDMKIKKCELLKALPVAPSLKVSVLADNLALENWKEAPVQVRHHDGKEENWPSFVNLAELRVINCPNLPDLPTMFVPDKLEISRCECIRSLPPSDMSQRLQHLALDGCNNENLVRAIPSTNSLCSLVLSNISNLAILPRWPQLLGLKALYIRNCQDLSSLPEGDSEGSLRSLTSLKFLSIRGCGKLETLPDEGLPTGLECLTIARCLALRSLGGGQTLINLTSLKDLYIENCPLIESFPEDGLPSTLQHLLIEACPRLVERCQRGGAEWPKIEHVPDLEINCVKVSSASDSVQARCFSLLDIIKDCLPI